MQNKMSPTSAALAYQKKMMNPFIFWWAMFFKLPSVLFWKIRMQKLDDTSCEVQIPYAWRTQNPFKSIYFAALAGAAELSTGALGQMALAGRGAFSMLVVDFKAEYSKKANTRITFSCLQGKEVFDLIDSLQAGESKALTLVSIGKNTQEEEVARFYITWSFKRKN